MRHDAGLASAIPLAPARPSVGIYFTSVNRCCYLVAKMFALAGHRVFVRFEPTPGDGVWEKPGDPERQHCARLFADGTIDMIADAAKAPPVDVLIYEIGHEHARYPDELSAWIARAGRLFAINTTDQNDTLARNLRVDLGAVARYRRFLPRTEAVIMQSGSLAARPTGILHRALHLGCFVHPDFLEDAGLRADMFDAGYDPRATRPIRLMFSGNAAPAERTEILRNVESRIAVRGDVRVLHHYETMVAHDRLAGGDMKNVLWMVRTDPHDPAWRTRRDVVPPAHWPRVLRDCDVSFCPPGYDRRSHRTIESLLQGTIPITDCPDVYDLDLKDGENCIVVRRGRWMEAVDRALALSAQDIRSMRETIAQLARTRLHYEVAAADWLHKLRVSTPHGAVEARV